ncbi:MAG: hypothetical protein NTV11_11745 [Rhodocyclales bacterium]|nr:hypothetical protein [Rhodocyclales bacterium]
MDISNAGNLNANSAPQPARAAGADPRAEQPADKDNGVPTPPPRRSSHLLAAVSQTLNQSGFGVLSSNPVAPVAGAQATRTDNDKESSHSQNMAQALQSFMHSLVQALAATGVDSPGQGQGSQPDKGISTPPVLTVSGGKGYGDLVSRLQSLVQSLSNGSSSATPTGSGPAVSSELNSSYQNLAQTQQGSGSSRAASGADLQTFLKTLLQNLQSSGDRTLASTGNVINTAA